MNYISHYYNCPDFPDYELQTAAHIFFGGGDKPQGDGAICQLVTISRCHPRVNHQV